MARTLLPPLTLLLALASVLVWNGCAKSLDALAPFPCAMDGSCPDGFSCVSGGGGTQACYPNQTCTSGQTQCGLACADTSSDTSNCGSCGNACPSGNVCCAGTCSDPNSDASNCGSCGNACQNDKSCVSGGCACLPSQTVCSGDCADLKTDMSNCGTCGHACQNGYCENGFCHACQPYEIACGSGCSTNSDPNNCGSCGHSCNGQPCTGGMCGSNTCNGAEYTCTTAGDVYYCGSTIAGCCKADHPYFCDNVSAPCWTTQIDCSTIVACGSSYYGCPSGQTYSCASMTCVAGP